MSTAYALSQDPDHADTDIYLLDKWPFESAGTDIPSPNPTASSTDSSRIVRSDYTKGPYADLAVEAQERWRGEWGADGRYSQSGYILIAREDDTERMSTGGYNHVTSAYENAIRVAGGDADIELLKSEADIERVSGYPITTNNGSAPTSNHPIAQSKGYINRSSGWVDAAASIQYLRSQVAATNRIKCIHGNAHKLLYSPLQDLPSGRRTVHGILLTSGQEILASQTILAAGPHTPSLTDLRTACEARGQVIAYVKLDAEELAHFPAEGNPCMMDASSGMFVVGPDRQGYIKITRDSKGYRNPVRISVARDGQPGLSGLQTSGLDDSKTEEKEIETSVPWTDALGLKNAGIPPDGEADCRAFLHRLFPASSRFSAIAIRPFEKTRTCWYCDTRTANFIISYHPHYANGSLFIATGGSGHAFKFLPVIGEKTVQILKYGPDADDDNGGAGRRPGAGNVEALRSLWRFPIPKGKNDDGIVFCEDGSRHGRGDLVFEECMEADSI